MSIFRKITNKMLLKNKTRTIVTIIGIILSAAMITATTTLIRSLQVYVIKSVEYVDGAWHGYMYGEDFDAEKFAADERVDKYGMLRSAGYALTSDGGDLPYYYVLMAADDSLYDIVNFGMEYGTRPQSPDEIMLPIYEYGGNRFFVGDTLTLDVGRRVLDGEPLTDSDYVSENETLVDTVEKTYTVTGFFESSNIFHPWTGMAAVTGPDDTAEYSEGGVYYTLKNVSEIFDFSSQNAADFFGGDYRIGEHSDLLMMNGYSRNDSAMTVIYSMAAILIALIMLGSVSLIHNAFSISVTERTKQFGLLSSIGATRRQIRKSVIGEALTLSAIGIPLGIVSGIGGIGVTLLCLSDAFASITNVVTPYRLELVVDAAPIIIAAAVGLLTVLISAWIPAARAARITAIEAIRQSGDVKKAKKPIKVSKLTKKLFGIEGIIAAKHYKRSKRSYRATIFSLTISIVLFVVASAFCDSLAEGVTSVYPYSCDVLAVCSADNAEEAIGITEYSAATLSDDRITDCCFVLGEEYPYSFDSRYKTENFDSRFVPSAYAYDETALVKIIDDEHFEQLAAECGAGAYSTDLPCIVRTTVDYRDYDENKFLNYPVIRNDIDKFAINSDDGSLEMEVIGVSEKPSGFLESKAACITVFIPFSAYVTHSTHPVFKDNDIDVVIQLETGENSAQVADVLNIILNDNGWGSWNIHDFYSNMVMVRNLILIIRVFSYGFIVLISLISVANVFNTISTGLMLRRREFAMLRTVGMTSGGLNKMMNYECILYGIKSSVYGVIISLVFVSLIHMSVNNGVETSLNIPWMAVLTALASVFLVVFATMLYSMHKIKRDNPVDSLRNDNI